MQAVGNVVKEELSSSLTVKAAEPTLLAATSTRTLVTAAPLRAAAAESISGASKGELNKAITDTFASTLGHTPAPAPTLAAELDSSLLSMRQNASNAVQAGLEDFADQTKGTGAMGTVTEEVKTLLTEFHT